MSDDLKNPSRRHFLKTGAIAGIGTALAGLDLATPARAQGKGEGRSQFKAMPIDTVRVGFVGVGGMDYIEDYRLIWSLRHGEPLDQDVYDAAAWSAIVGASCASVAKKGAPVEIPDFTRGMWKTNPPLGIVTA